MNRLRVTDSVMTRLLLLALGIVIVGTVIRFFVLGNFLREDLRTTIESQQLALAKFVAREVDDKIVQRQTLLLRVANALPAGLLDQPQQLDAWLQARYALQPQFPEGVVALDTQGRRLAGLPASAEKLLAGSALLRTVLAGQQVVGTPTVDPITHTPMLPFASPVRDTQGRVRGALIGFTALNARGFLDSLMQARIGESTGGFLLISPQDKLFVAASQPEMVMTPTPAPGINTLHDQAMAGFRGAGVTVNTRGVEEISAIASVPSTGWFVVARIPTREAFATVARLQSFLLGNALIVIVIFMGLSAIGLYFVFRPLFRAADHADRMTRGELPLEPLPVARRDEVGHLISAFNRLLAKLNEHRGELARMAHHDILTGLPNRALLADRVSVALAHARRHDTPVGLLFMDLDGFKQINDNLGHRAGDVALREVAGRLGAIVRQCDTLARVGGDEFVLLLSDLGEQAGEAAAAAARKCIEALKAPLSVNGTPCHVGVSVGIALGTAAHSFDTLMSAADRAMYQAKESGRGRYVSCTL